MHQTNRALVTSEMTTLSTRLTPNACFPVSALSHLYLTDRLLSVATVCPQDDWHSPRSLDCALYELSARGTSPKF